MKSTLNRIQSQLVYDNRSFWRNPAAAFFTFAFPLIFLVVFTSMFGNDVINTPSGMSASGSTSYIPAIITLSVINSSYTGLAMQVTVLRDSGFLKRVYGTPLPVWLFLGSKIIHLTIVGLILIVIVTLFGWLFYGVTLPSNTLVSAVCSILRLSYHNGDSKCKCSSGHRKCISNSLAFRIRCIHSARKCSRMAHLYKRDISSAASFTDVSIGVRSICHRIWV